MAAKKRALGRLKREPVAAVERAMRVIEMLADAVDGLSVSEVSRRLDVNKSIGFRLLTTLEQCGYAFKSELTQSYHLTYKVSNLGLRQLSNARILDQCDPALRDLAEQTGELVRLAIVEEDKPTWVYAVSGAHRRRLMDPIYKMEVSAHTHAVGKVWLSTLSDDEVRRLCRREGLPAITKYSIVSLDGLIEDLEQVRARGYAVSWEEHELGAAAIAAPIRAGVDPGAACRGVVSVAVPTSRIRKSELREYGARVQETARKLGESWPIGPLEEVGLQVG